MRPAPSEYLTYYSRYIDLVPEGDILVILERQCDETRSFMANVTENQGEFRYAPDKWTLKDVLGHVIDTERIFAYRALRIGRGDKTPIEGYEQDDYVSGADFHACSVTSLTDEFASVRRATISLLRHFSEAAWLRTGTANNAGISVRALAYVIAGHELHHRHILEQKYLS